MDKAKERQAMEALWNSSQLGSGSGAYIETLYEQYIENPKQVPAVWQDYFASLQNKDSHEVSHRAIQAEFAALAKQKHRTSQASGDALTERKQISVLKLIEGFRARGFRNAALDPLSQAERPYVADLDIAHYGLTEADLSIEFNTGSLAGPERATLKTIIEQLRRTYCDTTGVEFMHITESKEQEWIQNRIEGVSSQREFSSEQKLRILEQLTAGEGLERYLHTRYVGQKRFSLEGGESLIPLMDELIQRAGSQGIKEIGIGMAHRGRLNVLVNILGKAPGELFDEFEGKSTAGDELASGDVKYHQGFSSDVSSPGGNVHLSLAFNPSHLEIVSPVVVGSVRARQFRRKDTNKEQVLPISLHGDSAFAGQGVVMETFNMSQARGYSVGGTIHIIVNNQIGFTTSNPLDTRSTLHCTDVAKMVQAPIFHVNADDPEAVIFVTQIALDYRMKFKKDVVIDLVCYRRHGHNEADEPSATQPVMYQIIRNQPTTKKSYAEKLIKSGVITAEQDKQNDDNYRSKLEAGETVVSHLLDKSSNKYGTQWDNFLTQDWQVPTKTGVSKTQLAQLAEQLGRLPEGFVLQPQVRKMFQNRQSMGKGELPIDWGMAETLAYASILTEGHPVRISGQDSGRGTFAHRHAVLHSQSNGEMYVPLRNLDDAEPFLVIDSLLSEEAVLAFEYGYASTLPKHLVIWEAQFGDFANGAQVVIDQFISSGEHKWGRLSGLVMLLPHGYEGMGPEHSSARLERYLQLCAEHNMQVCVPSTPAQVFHMLRRQALRPYRKPLIVMTPKSFLRHKLAISSLDELAKGEFQPAIAEVDKLDTKKVRRVVICAGKVYYDLLESRRQKKIQDVAIVRVEQLYPFPKESFQKVLAPFKHVKDVVWCQEEPENQGAWYCTLHHLQGNVYNGQSVRFVGRKASASPAVGSAILHRQEQEALVKQALED